MSKHKNLVSTEGLAVWDVKDQVILPSQETSVIRLPVESTLEILNNGAEEIEVRDHENECVATVRPSSIVTLTARWTPEDSSHRNQRIEESVSSIVARYAQDYRHKASISNDPSFKDISAVLDALEKNVQDSLRYLR